MCILECKNNDLKKDVDTGLCKPCYVEMFGDDFLFDSEKEPSLNKVFEWLELKLEEVKRGAV